MELSESAIIEALVTLPKDGRGLRIIGQQAVESSQPVSKPEPKPVVLEETIAQIRLLLTNHEGQFGREIILTDPEAAALLEEIDSLRDQIEAARYYAALTETP